MCKGNSEGPLGSVLPVRPILHEPTPELCWQCVDYLLPMAITLFCHGLVGVKLEQQELQGSLQVMGHR